MKRVIYIILAVTLTICFTSCTKDEEENKDDVENMKSPETSAPQEEVRYYVKYEVRWSANQIVKRYITYSTEKGKETAEFYQKGLEWDGTYGPVKKGFVADISLDAPMVSNIRIRIYVSRDKEPFVIKAETSGTSAKYTIDF